MELQESTKVTALTCQVRWLVGACMDAWKDTGVLTCWRAYLKEEEREACAVLVCAWVHGHIGV